MEAKLWNAATLACVLVLCITSMSVMWHCVNEVARLQSRVERLEAEDEGSSVSQILGQLGVQTPVYQGDGAVKAIPGYQREARQFNLNGTIIEIVRAELEAHLNCSTNEETKCTIEPGPKGDPGPSGPPGPQGETGNQGHKGEKGLKGYPGVGWPGTRGPKGEKGQLGRAGSQGAQGPVGEMGVQGPPGQRGERGEKGDMGTRGPVGEKGERGDTGPIGSVGAKGEKGHVGFTGFKGQKGEVGDQGVQGPIGERGEKGDMGPRGPSGGEKGEQGDTGPKGQMGAKGDKGQLGRTGYKGEKGAEGVQGERGLTGGKGEKGDRGTQGLVGEMGEQGLQGVRGERGEKGDMGTRGPVGEKGERGDTGPTGPVGTKGQPGYPGFKGSKGEKGEDGEKGDKGQGLPGEPGPKGEKGNSDNHSGHYTCGGTTGWAQVAYLDMTNSNHQCPGDMVEFSASGKRLCGRRASAPPYSCTSATFLTNGLQYSHVCGRITGYQYGDLDGFRYSLRQSIESYYVDGVSVTHGPPGSREHIWTLATGNTENSNINACPCAPNAQSGERVPLFVDQNYFCESGFGYSSPQHSLSSADPLWDGNGCTIAGNTCCEFNNPPYFTRHLTNPTSNDLEVRACGRYGRDHSGEDTLIELIELYVKQ